MKQGNEVIATNLDGETARGEIVKIRAETVEDRRAEWFGQDRTLLDYWRGAGIDPDEAVIAVQIGEKVYEYPESRVEVIDDG